MENPLAVVAKYQEVAPVNLNGISRELGIRVFQTYLGKNAQGHMIAGKILRDSSAKAGFSIYLNSGEHPNRQRFTHAHELAHFILHRDLIESGVVDDTMYRSGLSDQLEIQANRLAADILMPVPLVKKWRATIRDDQLAELFQVSPAAMRIRLESIDRSRL